MTILFQILEYIALNDFHLPKVKDGVPDACKGTYAYRKEIDPKTL